MLAPTGLIATLDFGTNRAPFEALAEAGDGVLALITRTEGPSYRPVGAVMAFLADGRRIGSLSSGCVEGDLALHGAAALAEGCAKTVRYGRGSPYIDIQLPCGGGLEIALLPRPDAAALRGLIAELDARRPATLAVDRQTGQSACTDSEAPVPASAFGVRFEPDLRMLVFGKGPEASTFAGLAATAGYPTLLLSPDDETLQAAGAAGCARRHLTGKRMPDDIVADGWTAIVLFFHDHDWEPPILRAALATEAFYIGAQGSRRARDARLATLAQMGVAADDIARLRGPIGLVPSARDPRTLAVSVLAEILDTARRAHA